MILPRQLIYPLLSGQKTQITRPADGRGALELGRSYMVKTSRSGPPIAHVRVLELREALLHEFTDQDARREGFADYRDLVAWWWDTYRTGPGYEPPYVEIPVTVAHIELDREHRPRLLHRDSSRAYTTNRHEALVDEPEAVDAATLERFSEEARERHETRRREEQQAKRERPLEERVAEVLAEARAKGTDTRRVEASIEKRVEALARRIHRDAA